MKNLKKALIAGTCSALLVAGSVAGTMAYLTSTTGPVTNTFTVGSINITLDEAPVDLYGVQIDGERRTANEYKLVPGHEYKKDPTVHVTAGSEDCYLFVKLENGIKNIVAGENDDTIATIEEQMITKGWTVVDVEENVYGYSTKQSANTEVVVFDKFEILGTADVATYDNATVKITALAIQADGFETANEAWRANGGNFPTATV